MDVPTKAEIATARRLVVLVGVGYLVAQLLVFSIDRAPGWDEAIYLSQVAPGAEPLQFVPSRARGITFLAAPALQLGGSVALVRLFLAVAAAAALIASFRMWAPILGFGAPAAALLFAGAWPTLFYGSEVMPNLWTAFPAAAAVAVLVRRLVSGTARNDELIVGGLVALMALVRPFDAAVLTAVLLILPLVFGRGSLVWSTHLILGLAAGWAPWLVEMSGRFGGPFPALVAAARVGHTGRWSVAENAEQYLALSDGPTVGPAADPTIPRSGLFWLIGMGTLVIIGIVTARRRSARPIVLVPIVAGLALAAEYVVFTSAQAPRFLLPALALLTVPAGLGLARLLRGLQRPISFDEPRIATGFASVVLTLAWTISQLTVAAEVERNVAPHRESAERAGLEVRRLAAGEPCQVDSSVSFPMVGLASGCGARPLAQVIGTWERRASNLAREGIRPFRIRFTEQAPDPSVGSSLVAEVHAVGDRSWFIYAWTT